MPMYDVECAVGHRGEVLASIEDRFTPCRTCGQPTARIWVGKSSSVLGDAMDYVDDNLASHPIHITSRTQRRELMKASGVREMVRHTDGDRHTSRWI